jgi:ABC-type Mn2+/Zn2+ transport system permease subunit
LHAICASSRYWPHWGGGAAAFFGFSIAYQYDLPVGPTDVVLLGVLYAAVWVVIKLLAGLSRAARRD